MLFSPCQPSNRLTHSTAILNLSGLAFIGFSALDGIPGKKTVMESTANHIAFNFIIGRTGLVSDNCDRQFLAIRSHDGILVLRLVVEIKSQLANLCRFAVVLEIDVYRLLVLAFRSVV